MGKKSDKIKPDHKVPSALSHESRSDRDSRKSPEPYICTGNFLNDFTELSYRTGLAVIPPVVTRPRVVISEPKSEAKGKGKQVEPEVEPEFDEDGEPIEYPPKTFLLKDSREFLKPCVQVELEHNEKYDSVSELFIRGWKIDESMVNTLRLSLPLLDKLHTINLWNTGLTGDVLSLLGLFLPQCINVRTLILDNNVVPEQNYSVLISENSNLTHLSLRYCKINENGAAGLANCLGNVLKYNTKLLTLNLSGNQIGDAGAMHLATALRTNRALLTLNLASNSIGDRGVAKLAESLSRFALTHSEVVERRKLMSTYAGSPDRPISSRRAESRDRPASGRSQPIAPNKRDKSSKKKEAPKGKDSKEDNKTKKDDKTSKKGESRGARGGQLNFSLSAMSLSHSSDSWKSLTSSIVADTATKGKTITKETKKGKKEKSSTPHEQELSDVQENINALLEPADYIEEQLWISGNLVLISLNLSRNSCTDVGCAALVKAIQYQTTIAMDNRNSGTGLMRLSMHKNRLNADSEQLKKLTELMVVKDPFYKPKTPDDDTPLEPPAKG